ncbi:hypothetical protein A6B41_01585 [Mannheimia granulomatis]|nr:hypothetical protein A6B41_01585 [Mannheimia granulomatis]
MANRVAGQHFIFHFLSIIVSRLFSNNSRDTKYLTKYSEYPTEVTEGGYLLQQVQVNKDDSKSIVLTR